MYLNALKYLDAVVRYGSFSKAADSIPISHQGLIKSVRHLEDELGLSLLERDGKKIVLSKDGEALMPHVRVLLGDYRILMAHANMFRESDKKQRNPLMCITPMVTATLLPAINSEDLERWYSSLVVLEVTENEICKKITRNMSRAFGIVCVGFERTLSFEQQGLIYEPLYTHDFMIGATNELVAEGTTEISYQDLKDLPLAYMNKPVFNEAVMGLFGGERPENTEVHTSGIAAILNMTSRGHVAMLTDSLSAFSRAKLEDYPFIHVSARPWGSTGLLYSASAMENKELKSYIDTVRADICTNLEDYIAQHHS